MPSDTLNMKMLGNWKITSAGSQTPHRQLETSTPLNQNAPVYLIEARFRTDSVTRIISRVKKARLFYRSFDPQESPRLSAREAFEQVPNPLVYFYISCHIRFLMRRPTICEWHSWVD